MGLDSSKCILLLKFVFLISFNPVVQLKVMNCPFDCYDLKIHFIKFIWRSNGQNYIFALETWDVDGNDMQCNVNEVKWELQNGVSTHHVWELQKLWDLQHILGMNIENYDHLALNPNYV